MFQKRIHRHFPPLQFQATAVRDCLRSKRVYCLVYLKHFDVHHHHSLPSTKGSSIEALVITAALHGPTCNVDAIAEDVGDASRSPLLLPLPLLLPVPSVLVGATGRCAVGSRGAAVGITVPFGTVEFVPSCSTHPQTAAPVDCKKEHTSELHAVTS